MFAIIKQKLANLDKPINVAIVGTGWVGGGLARELYRIKGTNPKVLFDKIPERGVVVFRELGIDKSKIQYVENAFQVRDAEKHNKYIVCSDIKLLNELSDIDLVYEATGDLTAGIETCLISAEKSLPFINANFEMDATIGLRLVDITREKGSLYCNSDGDQPSCLARMIDEITLWGFEPKISGNCKAFMDYYQNPLGVVPYVPKHQNNHMVCGMADGTKQSIEMAVLGNAKGYYPLKRGMYGPTTTKQQLIKTFDELVDLSSLQGSYVDFVFGINGVDQGGGVFVIAYRDTPHIQEDMQYLKKGEGPFYLFFRDHHLCYFEAVSSIAEAVLFNTSTFYPKTWLIDVIAVAKRDLSPGIKLDGLGGYDCFGIVERADRAAQEKALPVGLAEFATVTKSLKKGEPITYDSVELEDALAVKLRKEQESRVAAQKRKERCLKEAVNL